ncbi:unnamed protein product [Fraxinus pennsylvanica]|uniref:Transcription repressor n=1 Tax=Fraxinus pennsylvanica TaxID=56036 RepID=A0AAD1Z4B4_9LAMI|nr:unnamed protein product [Fraxinus pennsylvanica]
MKWGRKKSASPSTHCHALITRVFPVSWLVKFKQNGVSFEPNSAEKKQKSKLKSPSSRSYECASWKEGRFCNMDDDVYWKLLFGEERIKARNSSHGMNSVKYYSDDELGFPTEMTTQDNQQFNDMALDTRKMKEIQHEMRNMWENQYSRSKKENGKATYKTPRRKAKKDRKSKNLEKKGAENERRPDEEKSLKTVEKDIFEISMESRVVHMKEKDYVKPAASNSREQQGIFFPSSSARKFEEDCTFDDLNLEESNATCQEDFNLGRQQCEDKKIKDIISHNEPHRKSAYISKESPTRTKQKLKVCSPRTECKIRALEDIKKARTKYKKKTREKGVGGSTVFDNFAVVKCSFAPEQDFRDSMVEMIREKGIRRPDELEELLACYLTLNCDKYHDLIIKVFQQVWLFELNQEFIDLEIGNDHLIYDK